MVKVAHIILFVSFLIFAGCIQRPLSEEEKRQLDHLDSHEVVLTYFSSGDRAVESYLSTKRERENRRRTVPERERVGGIDNLSVKPGIQNEHIQQFFVTYTSRNRNSIGMPPGLRTYFVYTVQDPLTKQWKIDSLGSGP